MKKKDLITFTTEDFTDDIQETMIKNRHRAFPVLNSKGICLGTISRRNFLDMHKKKVILVDHNEKDQAADNIESAEVLEILDHHKLGSLETMKPISFRNQPVGCTGTIMYQIYGEQRLEISPKIAGLLCSAIISDTLMFRSPTCTLQDKMAAGALALIAGISIPEYAKEMFRAGSNLKHKAPEEIFYQDFKVFHVDDDTFAVAQVSAVSGTQLDSIRAKLASYMETVRNNMQLNMVFVMMTNIIDQSTELLYYGSNAENIVSSTFGADKLSARNSAILPGVVSRKKQLIPPIMESLQE
jgi:manganese-dependent inorganic pyrophosphatase